MNANDFGQLAYILLMLVVVGGYFFVSNRNQIGRMTRHALLWALIFVGVLAGVGLWDEVRTTLAPAQQVYANGEVIALPRGQDGHYYATLVVNGERQRFLVDTGATDIVLTRDVARKFGLDPDNLVYSGIAGTANGQVRTAPVVLDTVSLGPLMDRDVRAMVNDGDLGTPLLGMAYLNRFSSIQISEGALTLTR
ncbi:retropepsin-like aspartic protease family protein [Pseudooceanicola algae]|uniref:Retroviral aspartyl protease n=1 Tax=Pseudooceanicola algae TaxID=1537215 RepID=A0A418SEH1_9RHOB|nr:TIGR02281 family clan AA aspartic protease [Pseudooceanicola algae]QPM89766.1 hypothetical protein PSAL_009920 [Pseudooceanicola algae]